MRRELCVLLLLSCALPVPAYRYYLARLPNFDRVPATSGNDLDYGSGICEAFGHERCGPQDSENDFGEDMEDLGGFWTEAFCARDSDGDGFTNGDELGDPCCVWNMDSGPPSRTTDISHPSRASSVPTSPSCSGAAPSGVTVAVDGAPSDTWATLTVTVPPTVCACSFSVVVTPSGGSGVTTEYDPAASLVVCSLTASTAYTVSVSASNRAGASGTSSTSFTTAAAGTGAPLASTCTAARSVQTAGAVRTETTKPVPGTLVILVPALVVLAIGSAVCCTLTRNPASKLWSWQRVPKTGAPTGMLCAELLFVVAAVGAFYGCWVWMDSEGYAYGQKAAVARAIGYAGAAALGLLFIPVTKNSLCLAVSGSSFERALRLHRFMGQLAVVLVVVHGIWMAVEYDSTPMGLSHMFRWSTEDSLNTLPGTLAGILMVIVFFTSRNWVRRKAYAFFTVAHFLWIPILIMTLLHLRSSEVAVAVLLLPPLFIFGADKLLYTLDFFLRPTRVVEWSHIPGAGQQYAALVVEKQLHPRLAALVPAALLKYVQFSYEAGQYVFVVVPQVSKLPHPFTVSSAPSPDAPGRLKLHVLGDGKWTQRLVHIASERAPGGSAPADAPAVTVRMAGPFGRPTVNFPKYEHLLLAAGGVGVTPIAAEYAALRRDIAQGRRPGLKSVTVVWTSRSPELLVDFADVFVTGADWAPGAYAAVNGVEAGAGAGAGAAVNGVEAGAGAGAGAAGDKGSAARALPSAAVHDAGVVQSVSFVLSLHLTREPDKVPMVSARMPAATVSTKRPAWEDVVSSVATKVQAAGGAAVGVMVCGPDQLIKAVNKACGRGANCAPSVKFHVHSETFLM